MTERSSDDFEKVMFGEHAGLPGGAGAPPTRKGPASPTGVVEFCEPAYISIFTDVAPSIESQAFTSALDHYVNVGRAERRLETEDYIHALTGGPPQRHKHNELSFNLDAVLVSDKGTVFVVGWSDDRVSPLLSVSVVQGEDGWNTRAIGRCRRADVEGALGAPLGPLYGFWFVHRLPTYDVQAGGVMLRARFADGGFTQIEAAPRVMTEFELRDTILTHFAHLEYLGNRDLDSFQHLDLGVGAVLVAMNRSISSGIKSTAHVERYGPRRKRFSASVVVCLFGKKEYFFLQNALFSRNKGIGAVEFIYVSNSPELTEALQKEARIAEQIYGLSLTLVTLTGNAGFSAANNVAAEFAQSDRIIIMNPDVFPMSDDWVATHEKIVSERPFEQTALFGVPLYYDDGSLMHGGMYFEVDRGLSVKPDAIRSSGLIRVEHYGKGAPDWSDRYTRPRPVPAVTGALISVHRPWFERIGGFTEDYLFGHYEDADLCLKSLAQGYAAWMHDVRFWHLEGKGSTRLPPHEGGSLVNRWLFTSRWGDLIEEGLAGRKPSHPLLCGGVTDKRSVELARTPSHDLAAISEGA